MIESVVTKSFQSIYARVEVYTIAPGDSDTLKRQKAFLFVCIIAFIIWQVVRLPFSYYFSTYPTCQAYSCVLLPWIIVYITLLFFCLWLLVQTKLLLWPRRCFLTLLTVSICVSILSHGGYEHGTLALGVVSVHMLASLILYDDIGTPARWMGTSFVILVVFGIYEACDNPYQKFSYNRRTMVIEQCVWCMGCSLGIFVCAWYLLYYLRLEIEHRKLAEALAQEESQAKANFLARMSHEIRSPLNGVIGLLELLQHTSLDHLQEQYVKYISSSAQLLLSVLNDILMFSKLEAGKVQLEQKWFDLPSCLERCVDAVRGVVESKSEEVEVVIHYPHECPVEVCGDEYHLSRVIINLLNNAVKFTNSGLIEISVIPTNASRAARNPLSVETLNKFETSTTSILVDEPPEFSLVEKTKSESVFLFKVKDSGIGLSGDQRQRLFDPFVQADISTTRKFGGTGLGLSICQQIVKLWNGAIRCESEGLGLGCEFTFSCKMDFRDHNPRGFRVQRQDSSAFGESSSMLGAFGILPPLNLIGSTESSQLKILSPTVLVDVIPARAAATQQVLQRFCSFITVLEDIQWLIQDSDSVVSNAIHSDCSLVMPTTCDASKVTHVIVMIDRTSLSDTGGGDGLVDGCELGGLARLRARLCLLQQRHPHVNLLGFTELSKIPLVEAAVGIRCLPKPVTYHHIEAFYRGQLSMTLPAIATTTAVNSTVSVVVSTALSPITSISTLTGSLTSDKASPHLKSLLKREKETSFLASPDVTSASASASGLASSSGPSRLAVLVVDDLRVNQVVMCTMLQHCTRALNVELMLDSVGDGAQAVSQCELKAYDLIFMDYHMPNLDGLEATKRILQLPAYMGRSIPIVAVTAAVSEVDQTRYRESGMTHFLSKPITIKSIEPILRVVLKY